ncbi:N-acetyl-gamma-glutamyl-phosphate reductase [Taylorella equigenitalis]|uniref:N-acetyl-gamma-glutamyl-phosphate reductase n=2 Tax=Taylorella equigenitalis TaxID=29575 RepID=I7IJB4_9BURK|nr:N-acetyl-gamma-glutamyl-phosphate reductase [Taylorella equigenitalis]AFN36625.1 N-acetyl-gamma-glutamyl-phosphate reductase [Taylorella equigenitalis ATCC 35865]ASY31187.1 N-acetyl-gamma-glutamyl-phosphate reductase [Taylorella equigenitalis]ASY40025.1 N-acetyl-gamma-glutamyl-phosphate reductase [Taylorella equigenitalis]ASY41468.1 N-acetyl-gamma-glutamyl-phosphate reductase [Taylorella equigenitalis]KOS59306.1 N-acetyl-gamma-glutamyl-phosphate reductase [Taylorella equigenitalis]
MIQVSIAGGTGYTAGELLRLLLRHPRVEIKSVSSNSCAGERVDSVHRDLLGETDLKFTREVGDADVLFLCLGHGLSQEFLYTHSISQDCRIIDLGNDFRNKPRFDDRLFVYGITELNRDRIRKSHSVANPGCLATAIILAMAPLAARGLLVDDMHAHTVTGSTGAGRMLSDYTHYSYRESNVTIYKNFEHQHIEEIMGALSAVAVDGADARDVTDSAGVGSSVSGVAGALPALQWVPMRGPFTRGIMASVYTKWHGSMSEGDLIQHFADFYESSAFVHVSDKQVSLKEVVNTNKCLLHVEFHNGYVHVTSVLDNLLKGASGQAVQNMNVMCKIDEVLGLQLKGSAF